MPMVMIRCPATGDTVSTRHTMNEAQFAGEPFMNAAVRCSSCSQIHRWNKADAWLQPFRSLRPAVGLGD
jgi:hypothetical protein